eukprot:403351387
MREIKSAEQAQSRISKFTVTIFLVFLWIQCSQAYYYEKRSLGDMVSLTFPNNPIKALSFDINFHQFYSSFSDIANINKIIISSYKMKENDTSCTLVPKNAYCQEFNLQQVPFMQLNQTVKNCMEDAYLYIFANPDQSNDSKITLQLNRLSEDKACNGLLNSEYLMQCSQYKTETCLMVKQCHDTCGELECWRGEETQPFYQMTIPADATTDYAKNLCSFFNSVDLKPCKGCQIYVDILRFENQNPTLSPFQTFILSIFLVLIVVLSLLVIYYNIFLAYRNRPPFKVYWFCPQILFPRGERGLGRHNVEQESSDNLRASRNNMQYRPLPGNNSKQTPMSRL